MRADKESRTIKDSSIDSTANMYRYVSIVESTLGEKTTVGDFSRVTSSEMRPYSRVDRFSLLYYSRLYDYSYIGAYSMLMHTEIGKFSSISWGVTIGPGEHDYTRLTMHDFLYNDYCELRPNDIEIPYDRFSSKSKIGNDVWIGANVTILRGVEIGDGAVVGANSTVTKNVPPYSIVAGSPARIIRYRFSEDIIERMLNLCWWDFSSEVIRNNFELFSKEKDEFVIDQLEQIKHTG